MSEECENFIIEEENRDFDYANKLKYTCQDMVDFGNYCVSHWNNNKKFKLQCDLLLIKYQHRNDN